jgi:hypothetical protein
MQVLWVEGVDCFTLFPTCWTVFIYSFIESLPWEHLSIRVPLTNLNHPILQNASIWPDSYLISVFNTQSQTQMSSSTPTRAASPSRPSPLPSIFSDTKRALTIPLDPALLTVIDEQAHKIGEELESLMGVIRARMEEVSSKERRVGMELTRFVDFFSGLSDLVYRSISVVHNLHHIISPSDASKRQP